MRKYLTILALLAGCQTTQHLNEPVRSEFYAACMLQGQWPVSGCDCIEQKAIEAGAPSYIKPGDVAAGQTFSKLANEATKECREVTDQLLKDGLNPPGSEASGNDKEARDRAIRNH